MRLRLEAEAKGHWVDLDLITFKYRYICSLRYRLQNHAQWEQSTEWEQEWIQPVSRQQLTADWFTETTVNQSAFSKANGWIWLARATSAISHKRYIISHHLLSPDFSFRCRCWCSGAGVHHLWPFSGMLTTGWPFSGMLTTGWPFLRWIQRFGGLLEMDMQIWRPFRDEYADLAAF